MGDVLAIHERNQAPCTFQQPAWFEWRTELPRRSEDYAEAAKLDAKAMRIRVKQNAEAVVKLDA